MQGRGHRMNNVQNGVPTVMTVPGTSYITGTGSFLPGPAVGNDELERLFGPLSPRQQRIRKEALARNGIATRHYALAADGTFRCGAADMAVEASRAALAAAGLDRGELAYLAAASSGGDLLAPGLASMVQGELQAPALEVASLHSFCASGVMALQAAHRAVASGDRPNALVVASEFTSRYFRAAFFDAAPFDRDAEFLRWMLSDGAGAVALSAEPARSGPSLRIDWIDLVSLAGQYPTCMFGGGRRAAEDGRLTGWASYPSLREAVDAGALRLRQDLKLLDRIVPVCAARYLELVRQRRIEPAAIDHFLCHLSSAVFHQRMIEALHEAGAPIPAERLFSNLATRGNTGAASIYVMLDELVRTRPLEPGQRILLMVPESGRFIASFVHLTVVDAPGAAPRQALPAASTAAPLATASQPEEAPAGDLIEVLKRELAAVWAEFELALDRVPLIARLNAGRLTLDDYRRLLLDLRQQVIDGARWIARAASSLGPDLVEIRPLFIGHAGTEQQDFRLLEQDYVAVGGRLEDIRAGRKNIGSAALSAWMFHKAGEPNPIDLIGAMAIIEGMGQRVAGRWAGLLQATLGLRDEQVRFLKHHAAADDGHIDRLWAAARQLPLTAAHIQSIVSCARVTARLYRLQLEEIGVH